MKLEFDCGDSLCVHYCTSLNEHRYVNTEMYPGFQIMGSSGPLLEKFGGPLLSFGGPANL